MGMENKDLNKSAEDRGENPSASKIGAISRCRGFHLANIRFPWYGERNEANEGTIRHEIEENQTPLEEIEDEDRKTCAFRCRRALRWCREDLGLDGMETKIEREQRLWWDDTWSGQLDYLETWTKLEDGELKEYAFLADYKTLRGNHDPAPENIQLEAQACLVIKNFPKVQKVFVALIEPFQEPSYTTASYALEYLRGRGAIITDMCLEAMEENAPREAGSVQCKWCSALPFCPEARKRITILAHGFERDMKNKADWLEDPEWLVEAMEWVPLAEAFVKAVKATVRAKLDEGTEIKGYKLRSGGYLTTYDAVEAAKILMDSGLLTLEEIHKSMKFNPSLLSQAWADKTGVSKAQASKDIKTRLKDVAVKKPKSSSVVKDRG